MTNHLQAKAAKDASLTYGYVEFKIAAYQTPDVYAVKSLPVDACSLCAEFEGWRRKVYICHVCA